MVELPSGCWENMPKSFERRGWSQTHPLPAMTHEVSQSQARTITTVLVSPAAVGTYVTLRLLELFKARMWKSFVSGVQEK